MTGETKQYIVTPEIVYGALWILPAWFRIFIFYSAVFLLVDCLLPLRLPSYTELFFAWSVGMAMALIFGFKKDTLILSDEFIEATDTFNQGQTYENLQRQIQPDHRVRYRLASSA